MQEILELIGVATCGLVGIAAMVYGLAVFFGGASKRTGPAECQHKWPKWSDPEPFNVDGVIVQKRRCPECNMIEQRRAMK